MEEIKDTGKVWIKGSVGPVHAVRIDNTIFATGKKEDQNMVQKEQRLQQSNTR